MGDEGRRQKSKGQCQSACCKVTARRSEPESCNGTHSRISDYSPLNPLERGNNPKNSMTLSQNLRDRKALARTNSERWAAAAPASRAASLKPPQLT
eukprot:3381786-Rhodomonas_salina.2